MEGYIRDVEILWREKIAAAKSSPLLRAARLILPFTPALLRAFTSGSLCAVFSIAYNDFFLEFINAGCVIYN